jgi:RimJ/RimL family protein N-acetyltransferase
MPFLARPHPGLGEQPPWAGSTNDSPAMPSIEVPERITGEGIALRPIGIRDVPRWAAAFVEDPDLGPAVGTEEDPDEAKLREWLKQEAKDRAEGRSVELGIADLEHDQLIGSVILHSFDWRHERAEVGFWLIPGYRGQGAATEAVALMVDWAFGDLGLHRVEMIVPPALPNIDRVRSLAQRLGFREEAVMRERNFERGRRHNTIMLAVLKHEWRGASGR